MSPTPITPISGAPSTAASIPTAAPMPTPTGTTGSTGLTTGATGAPPVAETLELSQQQSLLILASLLYYSAFKKTSTIVNNFNTFDDSLFSLRKIKVDAIESGANPTTIIDLEYADVMAILMDPKFPPTVIQDLMNRWDAIDTDPIKTDDEKDTEKEALLVDVKTANGIP